MEQNIQVRNIAVQERANRPSCRQLSAEKLAQTEKSERIKDICTTLKNLRHKVDTGIISPERYEEQKKLQKQLLPTITWGCSFKDNHRRDTTPQGQDNILPSGLVMHDFDHLSKPRGFYETYIRGREKELGIAYAHITPSWEGLRLVTPYKEGMSWVETQQWMAEELKQAHDPNCKNMSKCSFCVSEEMVLYKDEELLFHQECEMNNVKCEMENVKCSYKGIPYDLITKHWWALDGGEPVEGERNSKLFKWAVNFRNICNDDEQLMKNIMPSYGLSAQECDTILHHALKPAYKDEQDGVQKRVQMESAIKMAGQQQMGQMYTAENCPRLPQTLPPLMEKLLKSSPSQYREAVANAVFPPLATHITGWKFKYVDSVVMEPMMMSVLIAPSGSGKSCVIQPINHIMADIKENDMKNRKALEEWKQLYRMAGSKAKPQRPVNIPIQYIQPDATTAAFNQLLQDAEGRYLYCNMNEIERLDKLNPGNRKGEQFTLICNAFDGADWGQERAGIESVTANCKLRFNFNASTTVARGKEYFKNEILKGAVHRINFSTLPDMGIGAPIPVYGEYDEEYDAAITSYIRNLKVAAGEKPCTLPPLNELIKTLHEEISGQALQSDSKALWEFAKRALIITYLKGCILWLAHGQEWREDFEPFLRWSLEYDLHCKMLFFGKQMTLALEAEETANQPHVNPNMLHQLPTIFNFNQVVEVRAKSGSKTDKQSCQNMIRKWIHSNYIRRLGENQYQKTS